MSVQFQYRASLRSRSVEPLERAARDTVATFFSRHPNPPENMHLKVIKTGRGGDPEKLIKLTIRGPEMAQDKAGVPVLINTTGHQGLCCLMSIPGINDDTVQAMIANGPYLKKPCEKHADPEPAEAQLPQAASEPETVVPPTIEPPPPEPSPVKSQAKRLTPLEWLQTWGVNDDEIERLKVTMAAIVYRKVGDTNVPNTLTISVDEITAAILEHMRLPTNSSGTYKGVIGNFYSTRISLFALKYEYAADESSQYTDWLMDCELVTDFIGGASKLAALTRVRDAEVVERAKRQAAEEQNPPPKAEQVAQAAGFLADASLLELAAQTLSGKQAAEEQVRLAEMNAEAISQEIAQLHVKLDKAAAAHAQALILVDERKAKVCEYVLSPEAIAKLRAAKARIDALVKGLGI